ncbi:BglG family transcription antiterminator [Neobacillus sedimentimangrovi]|jgi:lichenan operon transcriptional antiterminator|uniref:BglG family transcription antiterminator n=1 Tax=Neobacillus sedimentimangrovi TaxID=2699460 RepID=UPI0013D549E3|nr:PRD domain-containing protein [Neobacillus sedimentimangrovi]
MQNIQLNSKEIRILQYLNKNQNDCLSSQMIGNQMDISDKTARKYINHLKEVVEKHGAVIEMKKGHGYSLTIKNNNLFYQFLEQISDKHTSMSNVYFLTENADRERFILNKLLIENKTITISELASEMFVSKSTVTKVLLKIKDRLHHYNLEIDYNADGELVIHGSELEKRRFILNYFFSRESFDKFMDFEPINYKNKGFTVETLFIIVLEECRKYKIQISDYLLQNLVLHLALAIKRIDDGYTIQDFPIDPELDFDKELFVADKIVQRIENTIAIQFPVNEANYIALHLKSKANQPIKSVEMATDMVPLQEQLLAVTMELKEKEGVKLKVDQKLILGLKTHFKPLLTRLQMGIEHKNPLLEEIKSDYARIFDLTKKYFAKMPVLSPYEVDDHEWAYIVLHILAAMERYKRNHKLNVIVVCSTGLGSAQMLKNRLENEFMGYIHIVDVISYYQLTDQHLEGIDLIISTIDISVSFFNVPVINVSVFLNHKDIQAISKYIDKNKLKDVEAIQLCTPAVEMEKRFDKFFHPDRFMVFIDKVKREHILEKMIRALTDCNSSEFIDDMLKKMEIRETFGSIVFAKEVAFPHPVKPIGVNSEIVVSVIPDGVEWDKDHSQIKLIILMSPSKVENEGLNMILSALATFIEDDELKQQLFQNPDYEVFKNLLMSVVKTNL